MGLNYSTDAFTPARGLKEKILQERLANGQVYFSLDSNGLYFDAEGKRRQINGAGVTFVYGEASGEEIAFNELSELYYFPKDRILQDSGLEPTYHVGDIIINSDGTFYKIESIDTGFCYCRKMLVAGTGGGGGGGGALGNMWLLPIANEELGYTGFPRNWPYGETITGFFKVSKESGGSVANVFVKIKDQYESETWREEAAQSFSVDVGEVFKVVLPQTALKPGQNNYVVVQAVVNGVETNSQEIMINCVDMQFKANSTWDNTRYKSTTTKVVFPYIITSTGEDLSSKDITVQVIYTIDDQYNHEEIVRKTEDSHDLTHLFEGLPQGGHSLRIQAFTEIGNQVVQIGDLHYGIGWYTGLKTPMIWTDYRNNSTEINYDIINIPYWAFDPNRVETNDAVIDFYINNEYVKQEIIPANRRQEWNVETYIPEQENVLRLVCDTYILELKVFIERNGSVDLEPYSDGCELFLTPKGRSNNEPIYNRTQWKNSLKNPSTDLSVGEVVLSDFNWYNNGWMSVADGSVLRVSNGAKVEIPINALFNSTGNRTFEFDFKLRNAVDFSKLVTITDTGLKDADGNPILKSSLDKNPHAFLKYYDSDAQKGIVLGTQEAVFALGENELACVRYADNNRIKVSIVVDASGEQGITYDLETGLPNADSAWKRLVYVYINGVVSSVLAITDPDELVMSNSDSKIVINSDCGDVDIYGIRVYNNGLSYDQIAQNWIGDANSLHDKLLRYYVNKNILTLGKIDCTKVMNLKKTLLSEGFSEKEAKENSIPVMIISTYADKTQGLVGTDDMLPYAKGNKKCVGVRYFDPNDASACFHGQNLELDVQGTSSQGYPRRNYKLKLKEFNANYSAHPFHIQHWDGLETNKNVYTGTELEDGINIGYGNILETTFCLKADYMESSGTHNTGFANLIGALSTPVGAYNFTHPLVKDFGLSNKAGYRTTIFGFPIVVFHENAAGQIEFVGKYNFNIDKGATDSFGFSDSTINEYSAEEVHYEWKKAKDVPDTTLAIRPNKDKTKYLMPTAIGKGTFEQISECWEFTQNQPGIGKFKGEQDAPLGLKADDHLAIFDHFEARYNIGDFEDGKDVYSMYTDPIDANSKITPFLNNFMDMWNWVNSTDTFAAKSVALPQPIYYRTLSTTYNPDEDITYYTEDKQVASITEKPQVKYLQLDGEISNITTINSDTFFDRMKRIRETDDLRDCVGIYTFFWNQDTEDWEFQDYQDGLDNIHSYPLTQYDFGFTVPEGGLYTQDENGKVVMKTSFSMEISIYADGFSSSLYEKFMLDNARYRQAKFKNEFEEHFDLQYTLFYFIMTELLLCYDSRQKNMMLATYGPKKINGYHIWYPIFYDVDTQLGVNNSGQIYWDYDTDATPLETENGQFKYDSIFSGNGSVLWYNFALCFQPQIKDAYRALRKGNLTETKLLEYYNEGGSEKWSNNFKNIDANYKYLAPATTGYINQSGGLAQTVKYYYCLQGDRKLSRNAFFRNRLNYIDSQWLGGTYDADSINGTQIKMRYNANDRVNTSDNDTISELNTNLDFNITTLLSQFLSVVYDKTPTTPIKYDLALDEKDRINLVRPIETIEKQLDDGYALSQQLLYIRGPEYVTDLGDLSLKYLNELDCSPAVKLRRLQLGNSHSNYFNNNLASKDLQLDSELGSANAKTLLEYLDLSNLAKLTASMDISGCAKLETLKLMGTMIPYMTLPSGNMLKKVYFPASTTKLNLINPLVLNKVLTNISQVNNDEDGLYIDNLTNVMGKDITDQSYTIISELEIEKDLFGLDSYRMLKHLFTVKREYMKGTYSDKEAPINTKTIKNLGIRLTDVNWSPYVGVPKHETFNENQTYYILENGITYNRFNNDLSNWENARDDGLLFILDESLLTNYPITDIDMLTYFKTQHESSAISYDDFYFKSTQISAIQGQKLLPIITGRIHVKNTNAISEAELFDLVTYFNKCNRNTGNLEITLDNSAPSYSAHFVMYNEKGEQETLAWQKVTDESEVVVYPNVNEPTRTHYEFVGWTYDDGNKYRNMYSVIDEKFTGEIIQTGQLKDIIFKDAPDGRYTFVALFRLKGYPIYYQINNDLFDTVIVAANSPIKPPERIPYLPEDDSYDLFECNRFIGWTNTYGGSNVIDVTKLTAQGSNTFYAVFEKASVYDTPLDSKYLLAVLSKSDGTCKVGLNNDYALQGKICFPREYVDADGTTYQITGLAGGALAKSDSEQQQDNGLTANTNIKAVFFEGTLDNTSFITEFAADCFAKCTSLIHVDFPRSLRVIGQNCFLEAERLQFYDLSHVTQFDSGCFYRAGTKVTQMNTLQISPGALYSASAFDACGHSTIQIGNDLDRWSSNSRLSQTSQSVFGINDTILNKTWYLTGLIIYYDSTTMNENAIEGHLENLIGNYANKKHLITTKEFL